MNKEEMNKIIESLENSVIELKNNIGGFTNSNSSIHERLDNIDENIKNFKELEETLDDVESRLSKIESKIGGFTMSNQTIYDRLDDIEKQL